MREFLKKVYVENVIAVPAQGRHADLDKLYRWMFDRPFAADTVVDRSRRFDNLVKTYLTASKDLIYKPLKAAHHKISKPAVLAILRDRYFKDSGDIAQQWFGSSWTNGLVGDLVDWLVSDRGAALFEKMTDIDHVQAVVDRLHAQTLLDIETNLINNLGKMDRERTRHDKLPKSYVCNLMCGLYMWQRVLDILRRKTAQIASQQVCEEDNLEAHQSSQACRVEAVVGWLRSRLAALGEAGRMSLELVDEPRSSGIYSLPEYGPVCFVLEQSRLEEVQAVADSPTEL